MKNITTLLLMLQLGLLAASAQQILPVALDAQLAYQGTLSSNGVAVNTPHAVILSLWAGPVGSTQIGASITNETVDVNNGQFRLTIEGRDGWSTSDLSATNLYLQAALRPSGSGAPFVTLWPRQRLASVPRAAVAERALTIPASALSVANLGTNTVDGAFIGVGSVGGFQIGPSQVVKSFNGLMDGVNLVAGPGLLLSAGTNNTLTLSKSNIFNCSDYDQCYWTLLGNTGTTPPGPQTDISTLLSTDNWLGTTDATALELRVEKRRGLRLEPVGTDVGETVNVIGGYWQNVVTPGALAATISGGGSSTGFNQVDGSYGTVGGGSRNTAGAFAGGAYATVGGGFGNLARGYISTIGGGARNSAFTKFSFIGGGASNVVDAIYGSIVGGLRNTNHAFAGSIGGGTLNWIQGASDSSTIGGGQSNLIQSAAPFATIGGGRVNNASANAATIGGGAFNTNSGSSSTISGGDYNVIPSGAIFTTVAGGRLNVASGVQSVIGGGQLNRTTASGNAAVVGGGFNNEAGGETSTIGGGVANQITFNALNATIGGGNANIASADHATISGGAGNRASVNFSSIGGGETNVASSDHTTVGGGIDNKASDRFAVVGGGARNQASGYNSTIGGGHVNRATSFFTAIGGGQMNLASTDYATVAGGRTNTSSAWAASIGGGESNVAATAYSTIPGGFRARTRSYGQQAYASGQFASPGDAQSSLYVLRTNTSSTAQSELFLDGGTAGNQRMNVPIGATWTFNILVAARNGAAGGNQSGGWEIRGVVQNIGGTVSLLCSTITTNCATLAGTPFVQALNPQQALVINTKDQTAAPTRWVANVRTAEVIAP